MSILYSSFFSSTVKSPVAVSRRHYDDCKLGAKNCGITENYQKLDLKFNALRAIDGPDIYQGKVNKDEYAAKTHSYEQIYRFLYILLLCGLEVNPANRYPRTDLIP